MNAISIDTESCNGCGQCVGICPVEAFELRDGKAVLVGDPQECQGCEACVIVCPAGSITVEKTPQVGRPEGNVLALAAQVSLYPLRQESLSPAIDEALRVFREHRLEVQPGAMSSVITGADADLFAALQEAFRRVAEQGHVVMAVTLSNACPVPARGE
jgi:NAD-dependent dihydropyrimidine dehydrogenase PreA subunit/uncharacterized protein YqgV (UPF0045/DUF77 family)